MGDATWLRGCWLKRGACLLQGAGLKCYGLLDRGVSVGFKKEQATLKKELVFVGITYILLKEEGSEVRFGPRSFCVEEIGQLRIEARALPPFYFDSFCQIHGILLPMAMAPPSSCDLLYRARV